jgi:hypothetical protein
MLIILHQWAMLCHPHDVTPWQGFEGGRDAISAIALLSPKCCRKDTDRPI